MLSANVNKTYIAGDDDQAIYEWSGARPDRFVDYEGKNIVLNQSFRIPKTVHNVAERISNKIRKRADKEFKENKKDINFSLRGDNKYYYAHQCKLFADFIKKNGYPYIDKKEIDQNGVSFNRYSINIGPNQFYRDVKRFNSKEEVLGFVIGYNEAMKNF